MRIIKRIFAPTLVIVTVGAISYSAILADDVYKKYNETIEWNNSSLQSKIHMVPPGLAQNYVTGEEEVLLEMVADVNTALEEIKMNNGVPDGKQEEYTKLKELLNAKSIDNPNIKTFLDDNGYSDFLFYLNADTIIRGAYSKFNIEELEELESNLATRVSKEEKALDLTLFEKVREIARDFNNLEKFSKKALEKLGTIENGVLMAHGRVDRSLTEEMISEIDEKELKKFPHIEKLYSILNSAEWESILVHNEDSKQYYAWAESKLVLESLSKSSFIPVSSIKTVNDILAVYPDAKLKQLANHTINGESIVTAVYVNGSPLSEFLYFKRNSKVTFDIDYQYIENPKSIVTVEYYDDLGNQLNMRTFEGYVGNELPIDTNQPGYVLVDSENLVDKFPKENTTIKLMYEKYVPPVIIPPVEEIPEETPEEIVETPEEETTESE